MTGDTPERLPIIGWREWVRLPTLGVDRLRAKIDTGAKSSALHAFEPTFFLQAGVRMVRFIIIPKTCKTKLRIQAQAPLVGFRTIRSSTGHSTRRPVIAIDLMWGITSWPIEVTLVNRDQMGFRMLLGRDALRGRLVVDPRGSYLGGLPNGATNSDVDDLA